MNRAPRPSLAWLLFFAIQLGIGTISAQNAHATSSTHCLIAELTALVDQDQAGVHQLGRLLEIQDPKERVTQLSKVEWNELTESEQSLLLSKAQNFDNSYEIAQVIRIAGSSDDARWRPILKSRIDSWQGITSGWQSHLRTDAEKAFAKLQNSKIPEPRPRAELKVPVTGAREAIQGQVPHEKLAAEIASRRARVPEFEYIRKEAERRGLRVWLFGGTAAGYSHYVKWDLLRELGDARFQPNRFDYDYTNIYRSTQDLDIVVNGSAQEAQEFEQALKSQFPYFLGSKAAGWEVRSIKDSHGDKGGLLGDFGFMNQHTDSNSTGMVELTQPPAGESVVRDIRDWTNNQNPAFLKDVDEGRLTYYHSPKHTETPRFKSGQNPPIFSVIRALTKAFQYDLKINGEDLAILQREINQFDPRRDLSNSDAARWIERNGKKLFQHAVDLDYAWNTLEKLGLRKKLISIQNDPETFDSLAWWMNKEPLMAKPVGEGSGKTAESLGIKTVAHETVDFLAYESITRSHTGAPNVFISRNNAA